MKAVPLEFKEANAYVEEHHRHHKPVARDKYRLGVADDRGKLCGVIQVGRPLARMLADGKTLEVLRCCTDGTRNACSFLYARAARVARDLGYEKIITYILESEDGASLKAAGYICEDARCGGGEWNSRSRPRELMESQMSFFPQKNKYPTCKKQRWIKILRREGGNRC